MKNINLYKITLTKLIALFFCSTVMFGSSHREAPLISNDPLADNVDLYAFRSPDNPDMITLIATYVPLQLPHGGPNYYNFGENVRYEIHVDNDASVAGDEIIYRFTFNIVNEDPTTFFNIRLGQQNQKATYNLERSMDGGASFQMIVANGVVPPNNIGQRSITGAAGLNTTYDALFQGAVTTSTTGEVVFAGPTDDPFFVDLGGIFDLGDAPRQNGTPVDGVACYNVSALAIQVPISTLLKAGAPATPTNILDSDYVIGVWASASRPAITTISATGEPTYSGDWVQVSRLGMPLTNEAVIPIGQKDFWNAISPYDEIAETTLDEYFYNPELALYMDDSQFGGAVPAFAPLRIQTASLGAFDFRNGADGLYGLKGDPALAGTALDDAVFGTLLLPAPGKPRSVDLWPAFHTGVPNVIPYQLATGKGGNPLAAGKPFVNNFLPNGGDMLRLNMAVPPTPRNDANFSSLGLIQAAAIGLTVAPFNTTADLEFIPNMDGFPNGRRLEDDVTRIELQAVAGVVLAAVGLWYDDYDPMTSPSPVTDDLLGVLTYTTGVENNDREFTGSFPYLAQPHSGTGPCSGELVFRNESPIADAVGKVFVSSNNSGTIALYANDANGNSSLSTFSSVAQDADGIYYDETTDQLYQLNRSENRINAYGAVVGNLTAGGTPNLISTSSSDFSNGREIAVSNGKLVVAQDAAASNGDVNQFVTYDISTSNITFEKAQPTNINLWGMVFGGNDLFAIVDNSPNVAVFNNFLSLPAGTVTPTSTITVESMVRTHGIAYDVTNNIMVLTDVGSGAVADDGAIVYIANWTGAAADGVISNAEQIRIAGPTSNLGNPVDVAFDFQTQNIYVAERANAGGRVLTFAVPTASGDVAPTTNDFFQGASAIHFGVCGAVQPPPPNGDLVSIVNYGLEGCNALISNQANQSYAEFTPAYPNVLSCASTSASIVNRSSPDVNLHSCTPGVGGSMAMCVSSSTSCNYTANDDKAVRFDVVLAPQAGELASIGRLDFFEKAPINYDWINGNSGLNNYPTRYGIRVLKDGTEIFRAIDQPTNTDWTLQTFDFTGADFTVSSTSTFTFELLGYCIIANSAGVTAWDLDEINVYGACAGSNRVALRGSVIAEDGSMMEEIDVTLQSDQPDFPLLTDSGDDGQYAFESLVTGFDYIVKGNKEDSALNGVSTLDIILIQQHILGINDLETPFKVIAADVNQDDKVSAIDLILIRKIILGLEDEFPSGDSWGFVGLEEVTNAPDPLAVSDYMYVPRMVEDENNQDFVGVKYGDVNGDSSANFVNSNTSSRSATTLKLEFEDKSVKAGELVEIAFYSSNFTDIFGLQMSMEFNGLTFQDINAAGLNVKENNFAQLRNDIYTFSWNNNSSTSLTGQDNLFTLNFIAEQTGWISEMISISDEHISAEAYRGNDLQVNGITIGSDNSGIIYSNKLYQNTPNPLVSNTNISFDIAKAGDVHFTIHTLNGQMIYELDQYYEAGKHILPIDKQLLSLASGVVYYTLETNNFSDTKKMVIVD